MPRGVPSKRQHEKNQLYKEQNGTSFQSSPSSEQDLRHRLSQSRHRTDWQQSNNAYAVDTDERNQGFFFGIERLLNDLQTLVDLMRNEVREQSQVERFQQPFTRSWVNRNRPLKGFKKCSYCDKTGHVYETCFSNPESHNFKGEDWTVNNRYEEDES